jgi:hypothetical protein
MVLLLALLLQGPGMIVRAQLPDITTVTIDPDGYLASLFVEPSGKAHVAYLYHEKIRYAVKDTDGVWHYEFPLVDAGDDVTPMDILVDREGMVRIFYEEYDSRDHPGRKVHLLTRDTVTGKWTDEIVALSDRCISGFSAVCNSRNDLHMAYLEGAGPMDMDAEVMHAGNAGGFWTGPQVVNGGYSDAVLAVDRKDYLHVFSYFPVWYRRSKDPEGSSWGGIESPEGGVAFFGGQMEGLLTDMDVDSSCKPHVLYVASPEYQAPMDILYAVRKDWRWQKEKIATGGYQPTDLALVTEPDGAVHIVYYDVNDKELVYINNVTGHWVKRGLVPKHGSYLDLQRDSLCNVVLIYQDGSGIKYVEIPRTPRLIITPDTLRFSNVEIGSSYTLGFTVLNDPANTGIITVDSVVLVQEDAGAFEADTFSFVLEPGHMHTVNVTFSPAEEKVYEGTVIIYFQNGYYTEMPVTGIPSGPEITTDPADTLDFGSVAINSQNIRHVRVKNTGTKSLTIQDLELILKNPWGQVIHTDFQLMSSTCSVLAPGESCEIRIDFNPEKKGHQHTYLNIYSNDMRTPVKKILVTGLVPYPVARAVDREIDAGYVPQGEYKQIRAEIYNPGTESLIIDSCSITGEDASFFRMADTCDVILPGDTCTVHIEVVPQETKDFQAGLVVWSNALWENPLKISLYGTSVYRHLLVDPETVTFGEVVVTQDTLVVITFSNYDTAEVFIFETSLEGENKYEFGHTGCTGPLPQGEQMRDTVWFRPLFGGEKSAVLKIRSNDSEKSIMEVPLTGRGVLEGGANIWSVSGSVYLPGYEPVTAGKINVFEPLEDSTGVLLWQKSLGGTNTFTIEGIPQGVITLRADPDTVEYPGYFNTYLGNTVSWSEAQIFLLYRNYTISDIILVPRPEETSGSSNVEGEFTEENGKSGYPVSKGVGDGSASPVKGVPVFLTGPEGDVVAYDITGDDGKFVFHNIPVGHYGFLADYVGFRMSRENDSVVIPDEHQQIRITVVAAGDSIRTQVSNVTGMDDAPLPGGVRAYPNPVRDHLYLRFTGGTEETVVIRITGVDGRLVRMFRAGPLAAGAVLDIPMTEMTEGVYLLTVSGDRLSYRTRIMKISR